jgi:hypothetical protein
MGDAQLCGYSRRRIDRVLDQPQIDEDDTVLEVGREAPRDLDGHRGLADAARADEGHEASLHQRLGNASGDCLSADDPRQLAWKAAARCVVIGRLLVCPTVVFGQPAHGGHERIATPGDVDHEPRPGLPVGKRFAQCCDVDAEAALLDNRVGPDQCGQLLLRDHFARPLRQDSQQVERPAAELNLPRTVHEQLARS